MRPDESGRGTHECVRHLVCPVLGMLQNLWGRFSTCGRVQMPPRRVKNPPQVANRPHINQRYFTKTGRLTMALVSVTPISRVPDFAAAAA